jgi:hypothetical protein
MAEPLSFDTDGYIRSLRALEDRLGTHPDVVRHAIRRAEDKTLDIRVCCKRADRVADLFEEAKVLARMATDVQGFPRARVAFEAFVDSWPPPAAAPRVAYFERHQATA